MSEAEDLTALRPALSRLLREPVSDDAISGLLGSLGRATRASRACLFEQLRDPDGRVLASLRAEWMERGLESGIADRLPPIVSPGDFGAFELADRLERGDVALLSLDDAPSRLREAMESMAMRAVALAPVHVAGEWWGVLAGGADLPGWASSDEILALFTIASDVISVALERERIGERLRASEERFEDLFENASDLVWAVDLEGRFTSVNQAMCSLLGYAREELVGQSFEAVILAPENRDLVRRMMAEKLDGRHERTAYEIDLTTRHGERVRVEVHSRLMTRSGVAVGYQGTGRDLSERRRFEAQLRQAQKMEAVGRLAGGLAHDFNNLLTAINGYSERILDRLAPRDPMRAEVTEILRAGERAADLVRELMAFSRQQVAVPRLLDFNELLRQRFSMLQRIVGLDVQIVSLSEAPVEKVRADPSLVEQIVVSLVMHARDDMPKGGRIDLATGMAEREELMRQAPVEVPAARYVRLVVSDTGEGMDRETLARVFEPFFTSRELGKGTGLGLSTVYGIVKQCEGFIFASSRVGQGTSFHVYLPAVIEGDRQISGAPPAAVPEADRESILLVEDEDMIRALAAQILAERGYRVLPASHPSEAIEIADREGGRIDLLLTDVVMPGTTGGDLAQLLAKRIPGLKILFMSGYSDSLVFRFGLLQEGAGFLQKPFSPDALAKKVRELLDLASARS